VLACNRSVASAGQHIAARPDEAAGSGQQSRGNSALIRRDLRRKRFPPGLMLAQCLDQLKPGHRDAIVDVQFMCSLEQVLPLPVGIGIVRAVDASWLMRATRCLILGLRS
jgi:hypothetical protein